MAMRFKPSRGADKRNFRRGERTNFKNKQLYIPRGGIRL